MQLQFRVSSSFAATLLVVSTALPGHCALGRLGAYSARQTNRLAGQLAPGRQSKQRQATSRPRHLLHALGRAGKSLVAHGKASKQSQPTAAEHSKFMWEAPTESGIEVDNANPEEIASDFMNGYAERFSPAVLLRANIFASAPLHGGSTCAEAA